MGLFIHVSFLFLGTLMPNMLEWKELIDEKDSNSGPHSHDPTYHCHACNKTNTTGRKICCQSSEANLLRYQRNVSVTFSSDKDFRAEQWIMGNGSACFKVKLPAFNLIHQ